MKQQFVFSLVAALFSANVTASARAQSDDYLMFYGYVAPAESMTAEGAGSSALYLFWGADDADLKAIGQGAAITLERDGQVVLGPFAFGDVADEATIAGLYAPASQGRRLSETLHALDDMFTGDAPVTPATFPARLRQVLLGQGDCPGFQANASACAATLRTVGQGLARGDANVARALFLGYQTAVPAGPTTWVLRATGANTTRVLGQLTIDPVAATRRVAAPSALQDVSREQQRCDAPGLEAQGVLALSWAHPEESPAVAKIAAHNIAGYHVFVQAECGVTPVDLRTLAAGVPHDTFGGFTLAGMTRLTDTPVQVGDLPEVDAASGRRLAADTLALGSSPSFVPPPGYANPTTPGWRPTFAQLLVPAETVKAAGLRPGQEVCVHVAAVDRAGQLGDTASITARVADFEKPPAPWDVTTSEETARDFDAGSGTYMNDATFAIEWPAVDVTNWLGRDGSVACNPSEAAETGRLVSAPTAGACGDPVNATPVDLKVVNYLVYRFEAPREAGAFFDTDGDGVADGEERLSDDEPGPACNRMQAAGTSRLVATVPASAAFVDPTTGRKRLRFTDDSAESPAKHLGVVSWYAVAAQDAGGWVGAPSAPVRAFFADKRPAARPALEDVTFGVCEPELVTTALFVYPDIALDATDDERAANGKLRLYCLAPPNPERLELTRLVDGYVGEAPFENQKESGPWAVVADSPATEALYDEVLARWENEECWVYAEVLDENGRVVAASDPEADLVYAPDQRTRTLTIILQDGCTSAPAEAIQPGQVINGKVQLKLPNGTPANVCGDLELEDGGVVYRVATVCGGGTLVYEVPDTGGTLQCYTLTVAGPNHVPGLPLSLPCVKAKTSVAPTPPQLDQLVLPADAVNGSLRWKAPGAAVAGIILQLENRTAKTFRSDFFAAGGAVDGNGFATVSLALGALAPGVSEEWCVRARALSAATSADIGGQLSDWAGPICGMRVPAGTPLPSYLPWPTMEAPPVADTPLQALYLGSDALPIVMLGAFKPTDIWPAPTDPAAEFGECGPENIGTCYTSLGLGEGEACVTTENGIRSTCLGLCADLDKAAGKFRKVLGYRQVWDTASASWGPWVQVTPFIERFFCFFDLAYPERVLDMSLYDSSFGASRFLPLPGDDPSFATYQLYWVDRYPHEPGTKIRYQFIRFGAEGQVIETLPTTEVDIPAEVMP